MQDNLIIEIHPSGVEDKGNTTLIIRTIFNRMPSHWRKIIPNHIKVTVVGRNLCGIEEFNSTGLVTKLPGIKLDSIQVSLVGDHIYAHHDSRLKNSQAIFQFELHVMFAYAMCHDTRFMSLLKTYFADASNNREIFAYALPFYLSKTGVERLKREKPKQFKHMVDLERAVKILTM